MLHPAWRPAGHSLGSEARKAPAPEALVSPSQAPGRFQRARALFAGIRLAVFSSIAAAAGVAVIKGSRQRQLRRTARTCDERHGIAAPEEPFG
ncbi:unnamed protein product, partial [Polarella glacialis]